MNNDQKIDTAALWAQYCDAIKATGRHLLGDDTPKDDFNQAEGIRYLTRIVRAGLESMIESAEAEYPRFADPANGKIKIGADNPDNRYQTARIRGHLTYRIRGHRGTAPTINFATKKGGYQKQDRAMLGTGFLDGRELIVDADGKFDIVVSAERPATGNWLPMASDSNMLLIRQTFRDRKVERPAELMIECVSPVAPPPPLNPEALAARLIAAANYTENTVRLFTDWASVFKRNHYNTLPHADQAMYQVAGGDPNITYYHGYWEIAEDEAMVIECDRPTCEFWNFQVDNYWMESLDYDKHRIHINGYGVEYTADDRVVIVVAHRDPGHPNWLTTAGHTLGTNLFRLIGAENPPAQISTRIVKFNDLVRELSK